MAEPPSSTTPFPMLCPKCHVCEGVPFQASTVAGRPDVIRVGIRWQACRYEWTVEVPVAGDPPWR